VLTNLLVARTSPRGTIARGANRLERSVTHLLHRANQSATEIFSADARIGELTPRQFAVLTVIADQEGLSQIDLVERTGIDRSTMANLVARLSKRGWVTRRRTKEDARAYSVKLSPQGEKVLLQARAAAADQRLLASLPPDKRQDFLNALASIVEANAKESR
jgi:DNA-binding MarR family transcriptional regulator